MQASAQIDDVLSRALLEIAARALPVFTFALYHDHESKAISVCVDTAQNSARAVEAQNQYDMRHFHAAVADGDLHSASGWPVNTGRNLSLGDFALVNVGRTSLKRVGTSHAFYVAMVRCVVAAEQRVLDLSPVPEEVVFACSGADDEVAYVWSAQIRDA